MNAKLLDSSDAFAADGPYAFRRMGISLLLATIFNVGMWAIIVVLPSVQSDFGMNRGGASLPYSLTMFGLAFGAVTLGRLADRIGFAAPLAIAGLAQGAGFIVAGFAPNIAVFDAAHLLLIGPGAGIAFGPLMADVSHWFVKRRGFAVVVVASGNYLAGVIWPLAIEAGLVPLGWRGVYFAIGAVVLGGALPLAALMRRRPSEATMRRADAQSEVARADIGVSPRALVWMLVLAGFACCTAMSMPQVHLVAYCGDLGYGVAVGAEMLSLMLGLGIISRLASGALADRIGSIATLALGSFMQGLALLLYTAFNGLTSLFVVSGVFGLFQGGIVPMYAIICRELLPPREAGAYIGLVVAATTFGMAFGGYASGLIFDLTGSYRIAFLNGVAWNVVNFAIVCWLLWRRRRARVEAVGAAAPAK